jgi:hypothetical protein
VIVKVTRETKFPAKMKTRHPSTFHLALLPFFLLVACVARSFGGDAEPGFVSLFDGRTFAGWKMATKHTNTWKIEDGAFVTRGDRCHLFYVGDEKPFRDFQLKVEVMTETNSNGGIYIHTKYQPTGWPTQGFESQVNVSHADWK